MLLKNPENGIVKFYEFNQIYVKKYSLYYSYTRTKDPFCIQYYGTTVDFSTPPTTLESIACHRARGDARQERRRRCDSLSIFLHPPYIPLAQTGIPPGAQHRSISITSLARWLYHRVVRAQKSMALHLSREITLVGPRGGERALNSISRLSSAIDF